MKYLLLLFILCYLPPAFSKENDLNNSSTFYATCKKSLEISQENPDFFLDTPCYSYIFGLYQGISIGTWTMVPFITPYLNNEDQEKKFLQNYKNKYPLCFPDDFSKIKKNFSYRDVAKQYIVSYETDPDINQEPTSSLSFFNFLIKNIKC